MSYQLTKELQKFIFSIIVLSILVVGVVVIVSSQFKVDVDTTDVELYSAYRNYKDCDCEIDYCIKTSENACEDMTCKVFGFVDKVEVCK